MHLPKVPYQGRKAQREIVTMRGVNYTDHYKDGELAACENLSTRRFPYLATRAAREAVAEYEGASAYYCFDGHEVVCAGGRLYFDGEDKCEISDRAKQFAVVGTKLCVFPDRAIVDVQSGEILTDGKTIATAAAPYSIQYDVGSITIKKTTAIARMGKGYSGIFDFYTYGENVETLFSCWETTGWNQEKLAQLGSEVQVQNLKKGDLLVPSNDNYFVECDEISRYNTSGKIAVVTDNYYDNGWQVKYDVCVLSGNADILNAFHRDYPVSITGTPFSFNDFHSISILEIEKKLNETIISFPSPPESPAIRGARWYCGISSDKEAKQYRCKLANTIRGSNHYCNFTPTKTIPAGSILINSAFIGSGTLYVWMPDSASTAEYVPSTERAVTASVDDSVFKKSVFLQGETRFIYDAQNSTWKLDETPVTLAAYGIVFSGGEAEDGDQIVIQHIIRGGVIFEEIESQIDTDYSATNIGGLMYAYESAAVSVQFNIAIPDLDFICEHQNRLWGVCNHQDNAIYDEKTQTFSHVSSRVIYASALGEPTEFYQYDGTATDSYALAVAGEGDFTAIKSFDSAVCAFKERKIHKILGSYPAEYYLSDRDAPGVQRGCAASAARLGSMLLYKGIGGVYAYNGSAPTLISLCFGNRLYSDAVGGSDEDSYYLSCKDESDVWHLFVYEAAAGIWLEEDNTQVVDFANVGKKLYFLGTDGVVRRCGGDQDDANVEWAATFKPLYETVNGRKRYSKMLLRVELPKGSYLIADVRTDGGVWREAGKIVGGTSDVVPVRLAINRCDKFEIRLHGKGPCAVLSMMREFSVGSDR